MFRAMSTRRDYRGYGVLNKEDEEEASAPILGKPKLSRNRTVPAAAKFFSSSSKKVTSEDNFRASAQVKEAKKASKIHPIFSLFETKRKKKATARPEFSSLAMFRALSTRRDYSGYDELIKEEAPSVPLVEPKLNRNRSVPAAKFFSPSRKVMTPEQNFPMSPQVNKEAKKASKIHPIFSLFETKKKKKATARPEFSRYIQYVREGGFGDVLQTSSVPPTSPRR
ncbi:hypothetical protein KY290_015045 [Solanum tuberosum]|uniref:TPX2 central domain-containing protein n=2 Tax=Solanum tuberosum TaxID=4113 RepID=A0ABQ7VRE9_SOLTU|nr:hypothetical protein KY290_015045 [Solanum tuberosum]